jgi:hypothetical protein
VPVLVAARLLTRLGNPPPNSVKFFAASELLELSLFCCTGTALAMPAPRGLVPEAWGQQIVQCHAGNAKLTAA